METPVCTRKVGRWVGWAWVQLGRDIWYQFYKALYIRQRVRPWSINTVEEGTRGDCDEAVPAKAGLSSLGTRLAVRSAPPRPAPGDIQEHTVC